MRRFGRHKWCIVSDLRERVYDFSVRVTVRDKPASLRLKIGHTADKSELLVHATHYTVRGITCQPSDQSIKASIDDGHSLSDGYQITVNRRERFMRLSSAALPSIFSTSERFFWSNEKVPAANRGFLKSTFDDRRKEGSVKSTVARTILPVANSQRG